MEKGTTAAARVAAGLAAAAAAPDSVGGAAARAAAVAALGRGGMEVGSAVAARRGRNANIRTGRGGVRGVVSS